MTNITKQMAVLLCILLMAACGGKTTRAEDDADNDSSDLTTEDLIDADAPTKHSDKFYERLLETFLREYYDVKMPGKYTENSVRVNNVSDKDTHTVDISGTFGFKGRGIGPARISHSDRNFEATVTDDGHDRFHVEFKHKDYFGSIDGRWITTGIILIEYRE